MNNTRSVRTNLHHITGERAYLIRWLMTYDCRVRISSIMALEENLEVLVRDDGEVLVWREDYPEYMKLMVRNGGRWVKA